MFGSFWSPSKSEDLPNTRAVRHASTGGDRAGAPPKENAADGEDGHQRDDDGERGEDERHGVASRRRGRRRRGQTGDDLGGSVQRRGDGVAVDFDVRERFQTGPG